jgi:hypothetical protein
VSRFDLVGPSYTSQSIIADPSLLMNWYYEQMEDPAAKSKGTLYPSPGLAAFAVGLNGPPREIFIHNGRVFTVAGSHFYELFATAPPTDRGMVSRDARPVYFAANHSQILICSAGVLSVFTLSTNALVPVDASQLAGSIVARVDYVDGFFVALFRDTGKFQYSSPEDGTTWDAGNTAIVSTFPDNVQTFVPNFREPIFFGLKQSQAYYDSGNLFTFDADPSGFIEQGTCAPDSVRKLDNAVFFLSGNDMGQGIVYRMNGFSPVRVSDHALEYALSTYPKISDAIAYTFIDQGHSFYHLYFPAANASWRYDVATGFWHQVGFWNGSSFDAHRSQCHCFAFGQHLVGDWRTGSIYSMSIKNVQDFGNNIRRVRRAPPISTENQWLFFNKLQIDLEVGLGPMPPLLDGTGRPRDPQAFLRWSDDGGKTWSNTRTMNCGKAGEYKKRVIEWRLGHSRDRVFEFSVADPIQWRIIDAYLDASPGFQTQERYSKQLSKIA